MQLEADSILRRTTLQLKMKKDKMFLCLGLSFLCLATTHLGKKEDKNDKDK